MSENRREKRDLDRRDFLKLGAAAGVGVALASAPALARSTGESPLDGPAKEFVVPPIEKVRIGYVGVGGMGTNHVRNLVRIPGCEIRAVCDIVPERAERAQKIVMDAGFPKPEAYTRGPYDFKRLCERDDLDLVYTATPWEWHVPVCVAAMEAGKHAATEVPAAVTLDEAWQLVETSERTKRYCVMMENCTYDREEMMIFNMVRQGLLGEILHGAAGYLHDLRHVKFDFASRGEAVWRLAHSIKRNGNLYPTHGLGPIAQVMDINRGDQFDYLVSMSTKAAGLSLYAAEVFGPDSKWAKIKYALGDVNVTLIRTKKGRTITLYHDTNLPRPYSRIHLVQGTKGIARKWPDPRRTSGVMGFVYIDGRSPEHHWETLESYRAEYEHPLWKDMEKMAKGAGHGGMDFIEDYRLIKCLREGVPLDMDVYDAAAWSAISELTEISVANRSRPVDVPDFTRGAWKTRKPLGILRA